MQRSFLIACALSTFFIGVSALPVFAADTLSPRVSIIAPITATVGVQANFSAGFSDDVGVTYCEYLENSILVSRSGFNANPSGSFPIGYTFSTPGNHFLQMRCHDAAGNWGEGPVTAIAVSGNDVTPPTVGVITPTVAVAGVGITFSASFSDSETGVHFCRLMDGNSVNWTSAAYPAGTMNGTVSLLQSFSAGTHFLQYQCQDNAGNWGYGTQTAVMVNAGVADTVPPSTGNVFANVDTPTAGNSVWYYVNASDNVGITSCHLYLQLQQNISTDIGAMSLQSSGMYALQYLFPSSAVDISYNARARCYDAAGNSSFSSGVKYFTVHANQTSSQSVPQVGQIQQNQAAAGIALTLTAPVSGNITQCSLSVNGVNVGYMSIAHGLASKDYVFYQNGYARVECNSPGGYIGVGSTSYISVVTPGAGTTNLSYGSLIKLYCPTYAAVDHPCRAVYYYGNDGKRHPFPNSKVYFSWYSSFVNVQEIGDGQMAAIPLGSTVRYRPGMRMVKFTTMPKVYAVSGNGTLRWVTSEALARALYTAKWSEQIDDIPDTFFANYHFGADITNIYQYNPVGETNMAPTIDANL